jgi:hypothetical protein
MKLHNRSPQVWILALGALIGSLYSPAKAQQTPSAAVACNFVGRFYLNPNTFQGQVVGYFTNIHGIFDGMSDPLFNGAPIIPPSESTAFFTFRSDLFSLKPLPANGDLLLFLVSAGQFNIYFNPNPNRDWNNPDTFSNGQLIAHFMRPEVLDLQFESTSQHIITETLVSSLSFIFKGNTFNFSEIAPGGITLYEAISNTSLPGVATFSIVLPFAGTGVAVSSDREEQD